MTYEELNQIYISAMKSKDKDLITLSKAVKANVMSFKDSAEFKPTSDHVDKAIKKEIKINNEIIETSSNPDVSIHSKNNLVILKSWQPEQITFDVLTNFTKVLLVRCPENNTKKPDNIYKFLYIKNILDTDDMFSGKYNIADLKRIIDEKL